MLLPWGVRILTEHGHACTSVLSATFAILKAWAKHVHSPPLRVLCMQRQHTCKFDGWVEHQLTESWLLTQPWSYGPTRAPSVILYSSFGRMTWRKHAQTIVFWFWSWHIEQKLISGFCMKMPCSKHFGVISSDAPRLSLELANAGIMELWLAQARCAVKAEFSRNFHQLLNQGFLYLPSFLSWYTPIVKKNSQTIISHASSLSHRSGLTWPAVHMINFSSQGEHGESTPL